MKAECASRFWQDKKITNMASFTSTLLALSVGGMAFVMTILGSEKSYLGPWAATSAIGAIILFGTAIATGLFGMITRLLDLRATAKVARLVEKGGDKCAIFEKREYAKRLGDRTWWLFDLQLFSFGIGVAFLASLTLTFYGNRLFEHWVLK